MGALLFFGLVCGCLNPDGQATVGGVVVSGSLRPVERNRIREQKLALPPVLFLEVKSARPPNKRYCIRLTKVEPESAGGKLAGPLTEPPSDIDCAHTSVFFTAPASSVPKVTVHGELFELTDTVEPILLKHADRKPFDSNIYGPKFDTVDGTTPNGVKVVLTALAIGDNPPVVTVYLKDPHGRAGKDSVHWLDVSRLSSPTIDRTTDAYLVVRHNAYKDRKSDPGEGFDVVAVEQGAGETRSVLQEDITVTVRESVMKSLGKFVMTVRLDTSRLDTSTAETYKSAKRLDSQVKG